MPCISRDDCPGRIHHVYIRGINKRSIFDTEKGIRIFLALLARAVKKGRIRLLAFCFMETHVHLVIESVTGELSVVIGRVSNLYCKIYNEAAGRRGKLYDGRFCSKPVLEEGYLMNLVRYIEMNPVVAGLCDHPAEHAFGSARVWSEGGRPRWLATHWFEQRFVRTGASRREATAVYLRYVGQPMSDEEWGEVEAQGFLTTAKRCGPGCIRKSEMLHWLRE